MDSVLDGVRQAVESISRTGARKVTNAAQELQAEFALAGRSGAGSLPRLVSEAMVAAFASVAREMCDKARAYDPAPARHAALIEERLRLLADSVIQQRMNALGLVNKMTTDARLNDSISLLRSGTDDVISDVVRDLRLTIPTQKASPAHQINLSHVSGNVNMAIGDNSRAQQSISQQSLAELQALLAEFRMAASTMPAAEREIIVDHVEAVEQELAKPQHDPGKVQRLARYLGDKAVGGMVSGLGKQLMDLLTTMF